jgi:hypothetical protein
MKNKMRIRETDEIDYRLVMIDYSLKAPIPAACDRLSLHERRFARPVARQRGLMMD